MSSLHDSVSRRRAAEPAGLCSVTVGPPQPGLLVTLWAGGTWVLPWSTFVSARFTGPPDQLELTFTSHVVMAEGDNLGGMLDDLAGLRLSFLRDLPADYRTQLAPDVPYIRRLVVRPAAHSEKLLPRPGGSQSDAIGEQSA